MAKQYTFKTTRHTEWLEDVLDNIPYRDRSMVIRELLVLGMKSRGMEVRQVPVVPSFFPVTTNQPQTDEEQTKVTQKTEKRQTSEPVIAEMEDDIDIDELERRLDYIGGM